MLHFVIFPPLTQRKTFATVFTHKWFLSSMLHFVTFPRTNDSLATVRAQEVELVSRLSSVFFLMPIQVLFRVECLLTIRALEQFLASVHTFMLSQQLSTGETKATV